MVADLYVIQHTEDNQSFLCYKQLNYDITAILQIRINAYVNPAELGTIAGRKCSYMFKNGKHTLAFYSLRDTQYEYLHRCFDNKGLFKDHLSSCNYVIKAYPKIVCILSPPVTSACECSLSCLKYNVLRKSLNSNKTQNESREPGF